MKRLVSSSASALMSVMKTVAPWRASSTAVARPLPQPGPTEPAPVTIATLPSSLNMARFPFWLVARVGGVRAAG